MDDDEFGDDYWEALLDAIEEEDEPPRICDLENPEICDSCQ